MAFFQGLGTCWYPAFFFAFNPSEVAIYPFEVDEQPSLSDIQPERGIYAATFDRRVQGLRILSIVICIFIVTIH